jgi:hypothetical protein
VTDKTCKWVLAEEESSAYETECGGIFEVMEGTPLENGFCFCCYCGGRLAEVDADELFGGDE